MKFEFDNLPNDHSQVIEHHSRSFSLAARILPEAIRSDVRQLYAWCRWCDDSVDDAASPAEARNRIELLREDIERIYSNQLPKHAASSWFAELAAKYSIPKELPLDLLTGMETDLDDPILETEDELLTYCYQAAGTVGLMMCRIMGVREAIALQKAKALGIAMQLTNIARDVAEDWQNGRRYIPKKWLSLIPKKDMTPSNKQVRMGVRQLLVLADDYYQRGYEGLKYLPDGARPAIHLAGKVYQEIGNEIRRKDFTVMNERVFVRFNLKMKVAARCVASEASFRATRIAQAILEKTKFQNPSHSISRTSNFTNGDIMKNNETRYLGYLGVSLTFVMATTLFFLMGLNPKATSYEMLPWIYTAGCALVAAGTGLMARRYNQELKLQTVRKR